jgi:hypothetical protein
MARWLVVIPFIVSGLLLSVTSADACSCVKQTPSELAAMSQVIFTGVARAYLDERPDTTLVEFQVETGYRGVAAGRVRVQAVGGRGPSELGAGCGWGFRLGREYTVFALDYDSDGVPNTNGCFRNVEGPISAATYGLPPGRAPDHNDEVLELSVVAALAVLAVTVISMLRRPRLLAP